MAADGKEDRDGWEMLGEYPTLEVGRDVVKRCRVSFMHRSGRTSERKCWTYGCAVEGCKKRMKIMEGEGKVAVMMKGCCQCKTLQRCHGISPVVKEECDNLIELNVSPKKIIKNLKKRGIEEVDIPSREQLKDRRKNKMRGQCTVLTNHDFKCWCQERYVDSMSDIEKFSSTDVVVVLELPDYDGCVFATPEIITSYSDAVNNNAAISLYCDSTDKISGKDWIVTTLGTNSITYNQKKRIRSLVSTANVSP